LSWLAVVQVVLLNQLTEMDKVAVARVAYLPLLDLRLHKAQPLQLQLAEVEAPVVLEVSQLLLAAAPTHLVALGAEPPQVLVVQAVQVLLVKVIMVAVKIIMAVVAVVAKVLLALLAAPVMVQEAQGLFLLSLVRQFNMLVAEVVAPKVGVALLLEVLALEAVETVAVIA
jgi:hypothetical protein